MVFWAKHPRWLHSLESCLEGRMVKTWRVEYQLRDLGEPDHAQIRPNCRRKDAPPAVLLSIEDVTKTVSDSNSNPSQRKRVAMSEIHCYEAFNWGPEEMRRYFDAAGYTLLATWKVPAAPYCERAPSEWPLSQLADQRWLIGWSSTQSIGWENTISQSISQVVVW